MADKEQARRQANLRLLQRTCGKDITDIVQTATHCVLYEFEESAWKKLEVEGSLFLASTTSAYRLVVLNRHSTDNFQMDIGPTLQLQVQDPYLIFRQKLADDSTRIRGIWFHSDAERVSMAEALQSSIQLLQSGRKPPVPAPAPAPTPPRVPQTPPTSYAAAVAPTTASPTAHTADAVTLSHLLATPMAELNVGGSGANSPSPGVALDKKSLQLALLSLIQDDRFLDLLHAQYLRVVQARSKKTGNK